MKTEIKTLLEMAGIMLFFMVVVLLVAYPIKSIASAQTDSQNKSKDNAIKKCRKEKGIPLMGFNYTVVCVSNHAIRWESD